MRASRVLTFARYEVRRAVARKKVIALVALTILIDTAPYYALAASHTAIVPPPLHPYLWIVGVFVPQAFFLQFIALLIAAGSMSEEYEQGTAEVLLSVSSHTCEPGRGRRRGTWREPILSHRSGATLIAR